MSETEPQKSYWKQPKTVFLKVDSREYVGSFMGVWIDPHKFLTLTAYKHLYAVRVKGRPWKEYVWEILS